ncbi:MAG: YihY/virulence factor BrkB family protein [Pseudomonadota bacterium]
MPEFGAAAGGLVDLVRDVLARYSRLGGSQFAAAISYRALFSLVPLATFAATVIAQVLASSGASRQDLVSAIADQLDLTAEGAAELDALIAAVPSPWSLAGATALGLALWGATGVMSSMQKTLAVVFDEGLSRGLIRGRLVSALLVLGALGLVVLAVIVSMLENVARKVSDDMREALGWQPFGFGILLGVVVPVAVVFLVYVLLYRYVPHHRPCWRPALVGAAVAALAHQVVQVGLGWYLSGAADFNEVYGSASAVFAFLLSVYLSASAFVLCAILAHVLDEQSADRR